MKLWKLLPVFAVGCALVRHDVERKPQFRELAPFFNPPAHLIGDFGTYSPLLKFEDGRPVRTRADWLARRKEIRAYWDKVLGPWPEVIDRPKLEFLTQTNRENFVQHRIRVEIMPGQMTDGYVLVPRGKGPFPGVVVPYYEPESSVGLNTNKFRDFALQLTRRGFVSIAIGSPGGDARNPEKTQCQPLSMLGYIAANCGRAIAALPEVDAKRIGVVGHSYGGKWAMFAAALHEGFACGVWSDPGIVFDESRPNVNYWEPWYLGYDPTQTRKPGVPKPDKPRTGPYKVLFESGRDLHEIMALIAPRPFLVSGGSEDPVERWRALNRVNQVYHLLRATNRVAMTNRPDHTPNEQSNEQIYQFFELFLK